MLSQLSETLKRTRDIKHGNVVTKSIRWRTTRSLFVVVNTT